MPETTTWKQLLANAGAQLGARHEAEALAMYVLQVDRAWLFAHATDAVAASVLATFEQLVQRRAAGEPLAYILGTRGFRNLSLRVTPDTLIPRPDTELLVEEALARFPVEATGCVVDLGTGSGAVALALAGERSQATVVATDASARALAVAGTNACDNGIDNVHFVQGDWCAPLSAANYAMVVCNPPYVAAGDPHLMQGDLPHEPVDALVSGPDGLDAVRRLVAEVPQVLVAGGWLLLEHGWDQGAAVRQLLQEGGFAAVFTARDLEDRERVSGGRLASPEPVGG